MSSKKLHDNVSRVKRPSPLGTSLFIGLRSLDPFLQYGFLAQGLAAPLLSALHVTSPVSLAPIVALGIPLKPLIILGMAVGSSIKQVYWAALVCKEEIPPLGAVMISLFNTVFNSASSILALTAAGSYLAPEVLTNGIGKHGISPLFAIGTTAYLVGLVLEFASEIQRKNFKDDKANAGKPYTSGLFSLSRHINYGGYALWRSSYALVSGGWLWGGFVAAFFGYDFGSRGIPVLDEYCTNRYGADWATYKQKVQYRLLPGIY